jgi:hypothetical protein
MNNQKTNLVHILLVEDNEGDILLLKLWGYKVKTKSAKKMSGSS